MKPTKTDTLANILFPRTVDDLFQQFWGEPVGTARWAPAVDVRETDDSYEFVVELPGVDPEDVQVTVTPEQLKIEGEKKSVTEQDSPQGKITERRFGRFARSFGFAKPVTTEDVVAESKRGVLTVTVKKAQSGKSRRIEIQSGE